MTQLSSLKAAASLHDVAQILDLKPAQLSFLLYKTLAPEKYKKFEVAKKSGGVRQISAPTKSLKQLQKRLANVLQNCIEDINVARLNENKRQDRIAHGFKRKRSILTNAKEHRNRNFVFNIDLKDFFGSINFGRIRGFFISDRNFQLTPKVATVIAQIACFENALPQGSPCSPVISNLIGHMLDTHLAKLAALSGCTYTRYADDLTFSTNKPEFPKEIASCSAQHEWAPGVDLVRLIIKSGFEINAAKTRMQYRDSRQEVTGLVVNKKVNVRSDYRHRVRAMAHRLFTQGEFHIEKGYCDKNGTENPPLLGTLSQLHGMLGFIDWVDRPHTVRLEEKDRSKKELTYKRFLLFKNFYAAPEPVIVCEGKTDRVYVTQAIRSLAAEYPDLADIDATGKVTLKIRRFRYTETSTGRILGLGGGTGDLKNLLIAYYKEAEKFTALGMKSPVIVLVDNDTAGGTVFSAAKEIKKLPKNAALSTNDNYVHVFKNLYLMATPTPKDTEIENLFDADTKARTLGMRTFDASGKADCNLHYGKADFAYRVVEQHAAEIDFSGFKPLLDRVVAVITHHTKMTF
jgi:RNA-directed DNA polymerase